jgi:prevent-host-death family protein
MIQEIPVTQARDELAELVNRVAYGHERITLTRHGKAVAGLVPPEDLAWLEQRSQERITLTSTGHAIEIQQPSATPEVMPIAAKHPEVPTGSPKKPPRRQ